MFKSEKDVARVTGIDPFVGPLVETKEEKLLVEEAQLIVMRSFDALCADRRVRANSMDLLNETQEKAIRLMVFNEMEAFVGAAHIDVRFQRIMHNEFQDPAVFTDH